ncbi:ferredoxin [Mycobacterium sp. CVI_P3]|uniref:Ferredoxin n=1 Tax=Mycobacterium pinniadriaticum TaxID=2994102 RepID=A0ABT3SMU6_9MYCO|nr:ferredoxin [Mycobacterium pinniadriaticum]MCX2934424.1 ferredoxin [Mycobacterium pinniadriaticum]MCX2940847.1 ferredoxin [Mycobacterium pinniadriaticum]
MEVRVDADRCQGHARCSKIAPEVFAAREEDGHAVVLVTHVPADVERKVDRAARACPERAIILENR